MSEYERLKNQKAEIIKKHREPGTKCPFGCPHESETALRTALTASQERVRVLEGAHEPLHTDSHQWSRRPCATCQKITDTIGAKFGCIRYAAEKAALKGESR